MPEALTEHSAEPKVQESPAVAQQQTPSARRKAEQGGIYTLFRKAAASSGGLEPPPEQFSSIFSRPEYSHPINDGQKARVLLAMQRQYGNRYVQRVLAASRAAQNSSQNEALIQRKKTQDLADNDNMLAGRIEAASSGGSSLQRDVQSRFEDGLGADLSNVRVHTDSEADQLSRYVGATAFTTGQHIFFRAGEYNPSSQEGVHLLAHEATHTVQQARGPVAGVPTQDGVYISDPSDSFEKQADQVADEITHTSISRTSTAQEVQSALPESLISASQAEIPFTVLRKPVTIQATPRTAAEVASDYEADALQFFSDNMEVELRIATSVEGAAIGRRASHTAADMVRNTCEPYERDQELDTNIMNTVFALAGGASSVSRTFAGGVPPGGSLSPSTGGINLATRIVNLGLNLVQVWMPTLAGYRTVGELKDAATRAMGREAEQAGETASPAFQDYENEVMNALHNDWQRSIDSVKSRIQSDQYPETVAALARGFFAVERSNYLNKLRNDYGARSSHAEAMVSAITNMLQPKLDILRDHLEAAKTSRQRWQAAGAIGAGIAGGAGIGAAIGVWGFGVAAIPGAIIGGAVGGVIGIGAAIGILWD